MFTAPAVLTPVFSAAGWSCPGILGRVGGSGMAGLAPGCALDLFGTGLAGKALWGGRGLKTSCELGDLGAGGAGLLGGVRCGTSFASAGCIGPAGLPVP